MTSILKLFLLCFTIIYSFLNSKSTLAIESSWSDMGYSKVRIISAQTKIGKKKEVLLGLHFKLDPGWKIYWRFPGDSGMPPELKMKDSLNIDKFNILWPFPEQIKEQEDIITRGYYNEVVLPIKLLVKSHLKPLIINADLNYQVCKDICIPIDTKLNFVLLNGKSNVAKHAQIIDRFIAKVPKDLKNVSIESAIVKYSKPSSIIIEVNGLATAGSNESGALAFINGPSNFSYVSKENFYKNPENSVLMEVEIRPAKVEDLLDSTKFLDLVVAVEGTYIEWRQKTDDIAQRNKDISFLIVIFVSFLGGIILNFMPCVLPVLSLKLTSILSNLPVDYKNIRKSFIYTSAGIISSFLIIGVGAILIRSTGTAVGWGMQFQSPGFILFLILAITVFSFNLFDFFQFKIPVFMSRSLGNLKINNQNSLNSFLLGFLATLLATPCTAPFVGTAVAYALSHSYKEILIIFTVMGLGMSLPYFILILFPSVISFLPKPGPWIIKLKRFLGLLLLVTAAWLGSILYELLKEPDKTINNDRWKKLNIESLNRYIDNKKVVFVDITADWCVTCLINKKLVLDSEEFISFVEQEEVILMRGDWTKPNEEVNNYLNKLNRYGIPLNVIHAPLNPKGTILPSILTLKNVFNSIEKLEILKY